MRREVPGAARGDARRRGSTRCASSRRSQGRRGTAARRSGRRRRKRRKRRRKRRRRASGHPRGPPPRAGRYAAGGERVVPNSVRLGCFPGTRTPPPGVMTVTNGGDGGAARRARVDEWFGKPAVGGDWPEHGRKVVFRAADGDARAHGAMRELRPRARHDAHRVRGRAHAHGRRRQPGDGEQHVPGGDVRVRGDPARRRRREALAGGPGRARPRHEHARRRRSPRTRRSSTWSEVRARREAALPREP